MREILFTMAMLVCTLCASAQQTIPSDKQLFALARQYRYGMARDVNPEKAFRIYNHLAHKGNAKAMNELGKCYLNGDGVIKDYGKAFRIFQKASQLGNVNSKCHLAEMYMKGLNGVVNCKKAYMLYKEAADSGSAQGMYGAGYLLYKGLGVEQNYPEAVKLLEKGAAKKHPGCSMLLASYYANGYDQEQDLDKADKFYSKASRDGNSWTVDVTKKGVLDSISKRRSRKGTWKHVKNKVLSTEAMPRLSSTINAQDVAGRWKGTAYTYDWSGKVIVGEQDVALEIESLDNDSIHINYYVGDSLSTAYATVLKDGAYFSKKLTDEQKDYSWTVTQTKFGIKGKNLLAEFKAFDTDNLSFKKPLLAILNREEDNLSEKSNGKSTFSIQGISYEAGNLTADLLASESMTVSITISSAFGMPTKRLGNRELTQGHNKLTLCTLSQQEYAACIVNVSRKDERHSKKVTVRSHE